MVHGEVNICVEYKVKLPIPLPGNYSAKYAENIKMHGGSGSGDENLSKAVELGIAKVNICTDLLNAARDNTKDGYAERSYYDSVTLAKDGFKDCLKHYYEVFHTK